MELLRASPGAGLNKGTSERCGVQEVLGSGGCELGVLRWRPAAFSPHVSGAPWGAGRVSTGPRSGT